MSVYPPPQPGCGPPPPGYGPPPPGLGPPRRSAGNGGANGVIAAAVAGIVIVVGIVATVLLVTSDGNTDVRARLGSGSNRPSGTQPGSSSTRQNPPTQGPASSSPAGGADVGGATSAGTAYFGFLDDNFYFSAQGTWCQASAFPLTEGDVDAVTSSYSLGSAQGSSTVASMQGHVSLDDGRSGSLTIYLRPVDSNGVTWCITSQSALS